MKSAHDQVARIIGKAAMIDSSRVRPETKLSELGIDSLARIECVLSLEETFKVELREDALWNLRTVQDVMDSVQQALEAQ